MLHSTNMFILQGNVHIVFCTALICTAQGKVHIVYWREQTAHYVLHQAESTLCFAERTASGAPEWSASALGCWQPSSPIKVRAKHRLCFLFHPHYHHLEQIMVIFKWKYVFLLLLRFRSKHQLFLALGLLMHVSKMPLMTRPNSLVSNKVGCQSSETKGRQRHSGPFLEHVCSPLTSKSDLLQIDNVFP